MPSWQYIRYSELKITDLIDERMPKALTQITIQIVTFIFLIKAFSMLINVGINSYGALHNAGICLILKNCYFTKLLFPDSFSFLIASRKNYKFKRIH